MNAVHSPFDIDLLLKEGFGLGFVVVVDQLEVHVHEERVEDLGQLRPVAVQHRLDELLEATVVDVVEDRVPLLAVGRKDDVHIRSVVPGAD